MSGIMLTDAIEDQKHLRSLSTNVAHAYGHAAGNDVTPLVLQETSWDQTVAYVRDCNGFLVELSSMKAE